jgi:hypothetical protein
MWGGAPWASIAAVLACYGSVSGYDFGPSVIGSQSSPIVASSDAPWSLVSGSDVAAGEVHGVTGTGGSVTGGDSNREGC